MIDSGIWCSDVSARGMRVNVLSDWEETMRIEGITQLRCRNHEVDHKRHILLWLRPALAGPLIMTACNTPLSHTMDSQH